MLLRVLRQVDPGPELLWENIPALSCPTEEAPCRTPRGGRYPSIPSSLPPPQAGPDRSQVKRALGLCAHSFPAPDKCVISGCSLMESSRGAANGINIAVPFAEL